MYLSWYTSKALAFIPDNYPEQQIITTVIASDMDVTSVQVSPPHMSTSPNMNSIKTFNPCRTQRLAYSLLAVHISMYL